METGNRLKSMLIYDSNGLPLFLHYFEDTLEIDESLFSGLLSAIGSIGKQIFNQSIATIEFGGDHGENNNKIVVITRELISIGKQVYFVFFMEGNVNLKPLKSLSSMIFLETKEMLQKGISDHKPIKMRISKIITSHWDSKGRKK